MPGLPILRSIAHPSLLADILAAKFTDHQPLYRQSAIAARDGVTLDPASMGRWVGQCEALCEPLIEALRRYTMATFKREALVLYCEDGRVEISNALAENALCCVALGRKNFLFAGSDSGGERAAAMYSLIGSCKLNDINPRAYLEYVLTHIADHPIIRIDELLPWNVAARLATPGSPPAAVV